jgi:ubiquinone/menaquinone biosynthesis C-methylase UbiE
MNIQNKNIDGGKAFDWGKTSEDYAKFRDIYPAEFYDALLSRGLCRKGQRILDLGTGTGVLPRNLYHAGAEWCGTDISPEQIGQAKKLAETAGMKISFRTASAETTDYPDGSFDAVTACQCYWYFDAEKAYPNIARMLKKDGVVHGCTCLEDGTLLDIFNPYRQDFVND